MPPNESPMSAPVSPAPATAPAAHGHSHTLTVMMVVVGLLLFVAAAVTWYYLVFDKAGITERAGEKREAILNSLPQNPAAKNMTFEERQQLLMKLSAPHKK